MLAFLTVGSTRFDSLVQCVLSQPVLDAFHRKGFTDLIVQCGNSAFELSSSIANGETVSMEKNGMKIVLWKFKQSLQEEYDCADLVIGHAGSGTILDVLRLGKPLIVVPNPTLLHNHQEELAGALASLGHLHTSTIPDLARTIETFDSANIVPFPPFDGSKFASLLDDEMGFI